MTMYPITEAEIENYVAEAWPDAQHTAGGYYFEENPHLFSEVNGNWFDIMGLSIKPIVEFLNQHTTKPILQFPKLVAVLGHPISHSKSPRMHRALVKNQFNFRRLYRYRYPTTAVFRDLEGAHHRRSFGL